MSVTSSARMRVLALRCVTLCLFGWLLAGCGGGSTGGGSTAGGGGTAPTQPPGDFSLSASPQTVTLSGGQSLTVTIAATQINTFTASITVAANGVPAGVTASPASFSLLAGKQQIVTLSAPATVTPGSGQITFQATSGSLSHSAQVMLNLIVPVTGPHPPIRTRYLRTNSFYDPNSLQYAPPRFTVYDAANNHFFVSNPYQNEIDVFDAAQQAEIAQIPVPEAWGIDLTPSNGNLYAGTLIGDVYQIDTSTLSVIKRYPSASIGPSGFSASTALVLADGRLALQGRQGGILGIDGFGFGVVWDPVANTLDTGASGSGICGGVSNGAFVLNGDRTLVLGTSVDEGSAEAVCSYNPSTRVATYGSFPYSTFVREIIPTPDGTRFFLTSNLDGIGVFDAGTVQLIGQITGANSYTPLPNAAGSAVISQDGKTLYVAAQLGGLVGAYDTTTYQQTGWIPNFTISDLQSSILPAAIDATGLIVGPMGHGVGFIDASQIQSSQPTQVSPDPLSVPTGPQAGGTKIDGIGFAVITDGATLSQVYVGNVPGIDPSFTGSMNNSPDAHVTTPPGSQGGAVDLAVLLSDGGIGFLPEGFSYGPTILEVTPNGATAEGGQTGAIIGYGFGSSTSGIQVTVGGQSAPVTAVFTYAPIEPYPFPANALQFTIPAGTAGSAVDVTVTTPSGTATAKGAFHYTAPVQTYPVQATLQAGIYDPGRKLYFFADQAQIQILSTSQGKWLPPITLPGVSSKTQLKAISESPDGTKLAVSDFGGQQIYMLNPDNPGSATGYPMSLDRDSFSSLLAPDGLAVTNAGMVYFATTDIGGTGTPAFHKLDTTNATIVDLGRFQSGGIADDFDRVALSPDGTKVYSNIEGGSFWLDTSNDQINGSNGTSSNDGGIPDLWVSGDGGTVCIDGYLADSLLNAETQAAYIDWETWFPEGVTGQKVNQDGSILFQPLTDGIDLIARNTGRLLYRIQIPMSPADVYDPMLVAEGENALGIITSTGVSFVDLSSLPIAAAFTQPFAEATHSPAGSTVRRQSFPQTPAPGRRVSSRPRPSLRRRTFQPPQRWIH
jgi:hypothetical protein